MKKSNKQSGITLIALVITIIIMLVLVTVIVYAAFTDNGLIARAKEARDKWREEQEREQNIDIDEYINTITSYQKELNKIIDEANSLSEEEYELLFIENYTVRCENTYPWAPAYLHAKLVDLTQLSFTTQYGEGETGISPIFSNAEEAMLSLKDLFFVTTDNDIIYIADDGKVYTQTETYENILIAGLNGYDIVIGWWT